METKATTKITVEATVNAPVEKVWKLWNNPQDIIKWNTPTPEWHTPRAEVDLRAGGKFSSRMEARDGSMGFDFAGVYDEVKLNERISYTMGDGRQATNTFTASGNETRIVTTFDPENENPADFQRAGWQSILDNFKAYAEAN
jgi:uncharacterized protein YndB with AHSA1/START domain